LKKKQYVDDPTIAERIAAALRGRHVAPKKEDAALKSVRQQLIADRAKAMKTKKNGDAT
jgi:hypothetical protein